MFQHNRNIPEKASFLKVAGYITTCLGLIAAGFAAGQYYKGTNLDNDKLRLERKNLELSDSIARLKASLENEAVTRRNFVLQNTHQIYFNTDTLDYAPLLVSNAMVNPCIGGQVDGCWKSETFVNINDIIGLQFFYHNRGNLPVANVSLGYTFNYANPNKTIICNGGIAVGNIIIRTGIVHIYAKEKIKLTFLPEQTCLKRNENSKEEIISADTLLGSPNFKIGMVPAGQGSQGVLVIRFKVEKG